MKLDLMFLFDFLSLDMIHFHFNICKWHHQAAVEFTPVYNLVNGEQETPLKLELVCTVRLTFCPGSRSQLKGEAAGNVLGCKSMVDLIIITLFIFMKCLLESYASVFVK